MARYKTIDLNPRFLAVDLEKQLLPGSFAHAVHFVEPVPYKHLQGKPLGIASIAEVIDLQTTLCGQSPWFVCGVIPEPKPMLSGEREREFQTKKFIAA